MGSLGYLEKCPSQAVENSNLTSDRLCDFGKVTFLFELQILNFFFFKGIVSPFYFFGCAGSLLWHTGFSSGSTWA